MASTSTTYSGDAVTRDFAIGFSYTSRSFVKAYVGGVITTAFTFLNATTLRFTVAPPAGTNNVEIRRVTSTTPLVDFVGAATITDTDLDLSTLQMLHVLEENQNNSLVGMQQSGGHWDATSDRLVNLATPLAPTDGTNKAYVDSVIGSAADAEASADDAALSAADALAQAGAANASAVAAAASAVAADASADSITGVLPVSGMTANTIPVVATATTYVNREMRHWRLISSPSGSGSTQVDIAISGYDEYLLELYNILPANDAESVTLQFSLDGGSTYVAAGNYDYVLDQTNVGGNRNNTDGAANSIVLARFLDNGNQSPLVSVRIFPGNGSTRYNFVRADGVTEDSTAGNSPGLPVCSGHLTSAYTAATHVRIAMSSGNITFTGKLYGVIR
jgi:hypothetical protein